MSTKPDAVLFDFFNTIVRRVRFDATAGFSALLKIAKEPSSVSLHEVLARNAMLEERLGQVWNASAVWSMEQQFHRLLFDGLGVRFDAAPNELEHCFVEAAMEFEKTAGIERCLSGLRARGLRLGVVANHSCTGASLRSVLSRLKIAEPFEFVVSSADYGIGKPHPLVFETAVAKLGTAPAATWFVGDNLVNDIAGANGAGLFSVSYNPDDRASGDIEPDAAVGSWEEFGQLVETAEPAKSD